MEFQTYLLRLQNMEPEYKYHMPVAEFAILQQTWVQLQFAENLFLYKWVQLRILLSQLFTQGTLEESLGSSPNIVLVNTVLSSVLLSRERT